MTIHRYDVTIREADDRLRLVHVWAPEYVEDNAGGIEFPRADPPQRFALGEWVGVTGPYRAADGRSVDADEHL
jgi:hypothetical protein